MNQIVRVALAAALAAATLLAQAPGRQKRTVSDAEVMRVHRSAILIDTHNDIPSDTVAGLDIGKPNTDHMTDLPRMKKGGMGAQFFAVYVAPKYVEGNHAANRTLQMIDTVRHDIIEKYPNDFVFATTAADIRRAHKQHKIAALLGIEGGHAIEDSLRLLRRYFDQGVRYMTLTHTNSDHGRTLRAINRPTTGFAVRQGSGCRNESAGHDGGHLARLRQDLFRCAGNVDGAGDRVAFVLPRHRHVPRNMTDDMLAALAVKGGVVQINFSCDFLTAAKPRATLADVVGHINHVVAIGGIGAVGLGSDFDGISCAPVGLDSVDKWPNLTRALLEEGYTAAEIRKLYGENTLRLMAEVERVARSMR